MNDRPGRSPNSWRWIPFALVAIAVYTFGWRVTQIDLLKLATDAPKIVRIASLLLQPDVFGRNRVSQKADAPFLLPCTDTPLPLQSETGEPHITLSQTCGEVDQELTVEGSGFRPGGQGFLRWLPAEGAPRTLAEVRSDQAGHFKVPITIPEVRITPGQLHTVETELYWEVGLPYPSNALKTTVERMVETILLAMMATTFAVVVAVPLSFLAARNLMTRNPASTAIYYVTRTIFNVLRSIEPLIMAIVFAVWVGIGPFAGVLALAIHSIAALGKLYSEQVESIDPGPLEAITATGANRLQVVLFGVIPQIVPPYTAFTIYRWDINVRMSTVIGFVGGGGIGFILQQWINLLQWRQAGTAVWAIALVVATMDYVSAKVRERIV